MNVRYYLNYQGGQIIKRYKIKVAIRLLKRSLNFKLEEIY